MDPQHIPSHAVVGAARVNLNRYCGALLGGVLVALAALPTPTKAATKDTLVIGMTQYPATFHPSINSMLAKSYVLAMTRRPITVYDHDWQLICMLCETLPTFENGLAVRETTSEGKPGVAVTYTLRGDATWGDGTPLTTADVLFTIEVGKHLQSGISNAELYRRILSVDVVDDHTFTLHLDRLTFSYNAVNDLELLPAHIERPIFEAGPETYKTRTAFDTDPTNPGLAYGPYRLTDAETGSHVVLEPNPTWWGTPPAFNRIVVRTIENTTALEANLLSGAIDMIPGELGLSIDQAIAFEKRNRPGFTVTYKAGLIYEHIDLSLDNSILADIRVRRALLHALDRERIVAALFGGKQPVAHGPVSPLDWVHADDIPITAYDPDAAKALLDEAGWKTGPDGIRINAAGDRLSLRIMTTAGNRLRELVQQTAQSMWKQVGAQVRIENEPPRVFFGETMTKRKVNGMAMYAWISSPENVPHTTLHSTQIPSAENNYAGQNYPGYADPEMDALINAVELELNPDARKKIWRDIQVKYATDLPVLPLYFRANAFVLPNWLSGVRPTGHQYSTTLWIEDWKHTP